ncbi:MAG TPA: hypothetical protein VFZ93_07085 [Albitalea sp.]
MAFSLTMPERDALRVPGLLLLAPFLLVVLWSAHAVFMRGDVSVYAEDGPLESLQAGLLALACLAYVRAGIAAKGASRAVLLACAWLCFGFVLNELDVEKLDVPEWLRQLGAGRGRNTLLALGLGVMAAHAALRFRAWRQAAVAFLKSPAGVVLMLAAPLLFAGRVAEKSPAIPHHAYWEELLELAADCLILLSAWTAARAAAAPGSGGPRPGR